MKFSIASILLSTLSLASSAVIEPGMSVPRDLVLHVRQNDGRPLANGACCIAGGSKKQDVCTVNGQQGKCVPADSANCNAALTCVANAKLTCNNNQLENGRPLCRPSA